MILRHEFVTAGNVTSKRNHINRNSSASGSDVVPSNQMYHPAADLHQSTLHSHHIPSGCPATYLLYRILHSKTINQLPEIENMLHAGSLHNCAWSWKSNMLPMFADIRVSYNSNRTVVKIVYFTLKYTISHCRMQIKQAQIRSAKSSVILTFHTNRSYFNIYVSHILVVRE